MLFRLFPYDPDAAAEQPGGVRFVPRSSQGAGRHDNPDIYGAIYLSRSPVSAVAELLKEYRGRTLHPRNLTWEGRPYGLAAFDDERLEGMVDLDEPKELIRRQLRPSHVATRDREVTQGYARAVHAGGATGLAWWSTLEASWINVTLFAERALPVLRLTEPSEPVSTDHPAVREAAGVIGVTIGR